MNVSSRNARTGHLREAFDACKGAFVAVALISSIVSVLYLTGAFFMLEVYDRVVTSRSVPTLAALAALALLLYAFQGVLDIIRGRILVRIGGSLDDSLGKRVFGTVLRAPLHPRPSGQGMQPMRDLDQVRGFLSGLGPTAFFDLPWMPLYLIICFIFHPLIGITATVGALILITLAILSEVLGRAPAREAVAQANVRNGLAEAGMRNAEVVKAMGMASRLEQAYGEANSRYMDLQRGASDITGGLGATSKVLRMVLQSAVLGVGAYLVIHGEATAGIMIAGSILAARALAPVELAIGHWRGFLAARQSWKRLRETLDSAPPEEAVLALPAPCRTFSVERISVAPPGGRKFVASNVDFSLQAGDGLGIIGPSGSGKSSLVRALVGVWPTVRGKIRLDGAALEQWASDDLGRHLGYLPQDVELFAGTIAQNISRFDPNARPEAIVAAGIDAGVHDLILRLPDRYQTQIGEGGAQLSAGQRQRIGLARALYLDPFLVVLDEPNAHLDGAGEQALVEAIGKIRARGGIVVIVAHRPAALAGVDHILIMGEGEMRSFGRKGEILGKRDAIANRRRPAAVAAAGAAAGLRVITDEGQG